MRRRCALLLCLMGLYLGMHNGYVALLHTQSPTPLQVFPYRSVMYPEYDQNLLEHGIAVHSYKDLSKLLEDYFS